jgi:hypothetical protein
VSAERDETRIIRSWLEDGVTALPDRVLDVVLDQLPATPQRRTFWFAWRIPSMNNIIRFGALAAAVVIAVVLAANFLSGPSVGGGPEASPTVTIAASAPVSPVELPITEGRPLTAGTYTLSASFPVGITFEVPPGWQSCSGGPVEQAVCQDAEGFTSVAVTFLILDNVVADPCDPDPQLLDPPVGPSVDDLVAAISNLSELDVTAPIDVTVDGFRGKEFTVTAPDSAEDCDLWTWATPDRTTGVSPGEINVMRVLDVDGTRVVITDTYFAEASEDGLSALPELMASIQIEP